MVLVVVVIVGGSLFFLLVRPFSVSHFADSKNSGSLSIDQGLEDFFKVYWQRPIPLQGNPPRNFSKLEASLRPEACASCHAQQYADWKESFHSNAMGPGPWGQILDLTRDNPEEAVLCTTCHAPLSEQFPLVANSEAAGGYQKNPHFDSTLQLQGITCAACHVRGHQRFGPPKAEESTATKYPPGTPNHGGVQRTPYFEKAEFCKDCHQFDPENTLLVNGKPLQDTYREWQNSIWGQGGAACHECHMPGRRHLWKGIHDREMVKGGVNIEANLEKPTLAAGRSLELVINVTNAAVGHKFPTYITPKVFVRAELLDERGENLPGTKQERIIGWDARFDGGEWKEYFDTRISPGETSQNKFTWNRLIRAKKVRAWVEVHPDHFYHVHFYPAHLKGGNLSAEGRKLIEKALEESGATSYTIFEELIPLN